MTEEGMPWCERCGSYHAPGNHITSLVAPNGLQLRGIVESCPITYPVAVWREADGTVRFDYTGGPSKVWDEVAGPITRAPEGGGEPEHVFEDTSGNEWLASQLVPAPGDEEGEP